MLWFAWKQIYSGGSVDEGNNAGLYSEQVASEAGHYNDEESNY